MRFATGAYVQHPDFGVYPPIGFMSIVKSEIISIDLLVPALGSRRVLDSECPKLLESTAFPNNPSKNRP